jgi:RNA polymerase II-associated protein 2
MASQPDPKHLETALYHAKIIQHRKDIENKILENLETLIDYPLTENAQPESPSPSEAADVTNLLQLFQPSDFEELVDERRMANRCGYPLCPRTPLKQKGDGRYRIVKTSSGPGVQAVPKEKFESWCSPACTRRCIFLKSQLSNEPAWARDLSSVHSLSYAIGDPKEGKTITPGVTPSPIQDVEQKLTKLAIRPKPTPENSSDGKSRILRPEVVERESTTAPAEPTLNEEDSLNPGAIEGYQLGGSAGLNRKDLSGFLG